MKSFRLIFTLLVAAFTSGCAPTFAQYRINVVSKDGTTTPFIIATTDSITFSDAQMNIHRTGIAQAFDTATVERVEVHRANIARIENLRLTLTTHKACYAPGEEAVFTLSSSAPSGAIVRYRHGADVITEMPISGRTWTWTLPVSDFTGYMADIYQLNDTTETIYATVGIDVSSDWSRFPRYGFLATYDATKTSSVIKSELAFLNRCHINGLQFYDWHNKHHWPLGGTRDRLLTTYTDLANRTIYTRVIKDYIKQSHDYGMKAMFYNLCFGGFDDAADDGVDIKWGLFKDRNHSDQDRHELPAAWRSDIYLYNPANSLWQQYLADRNDDVYANFDFDGFHIDQLGGRGTRYDYNGNTVDLPSGYNSFIRAMKERHPEKSLVMNAVSNYGANEIGATDVDFMYSELWDGESQFSQLRDIINANTAASNGKSTVFAAYMNYGRKSANFNTPGVLLTDAVMFALGGAHLELGDHMLCSEYFPVTDVKMSTALKNTIARYYDFLTAYENYLRDDCTESTTGVTSRISNVHPINAWPPKRGAITAYTKTVGKCEVIHLLNFSQADELSWRDFNSTMPEPKPITDLPIVIRTRNAKRVWVASPDVMGGLPQEIDFTQGATSLTAMVPSLKYWSMIVVEY